MRKSNRNSAHAQRPESNQEQSDANSDHSPRQNAAPKIADYRQFLARATNDAVRDWDLTNDTLSWPQGLDHLLGHQGQPADQTIQFWLDRVHPADRARVTASLRDAIESEEAHWLGEYRFQCPNGGYLHLLERALILRDKNGKAIRLIGVLMDMTASKQLQQQFARSQRMEAFGQLAGGVAHDFNNFLTTILGYSDLVVAEVEGRGTIAKYISEIRSAAGRASSLTRQLLAFSRRQPMEPRILEVNSTISNLERSILRLLGENIAVICELLPDKQPAHIKVDPNQFTQIIVNLAVNARDAMPSGGTLTLKSDIISVTGKSNDPLMPELPPGKFVVISVIDDGIGISDEIKAHIFEPFFTTKDDRFGSGLGLATCYGIIRQSGGHISLESELGKGTAVHIYLPLVAPPPRTTHRKPRLSSLPSGDETVLVVEDDRSVRHVVVRTLRSLGYNVVEALRADDAKQRITENADGINVVVSDVMLPDMSGCAFADWTRTHSPQTQIVLVSGYLSDVTNGVDTRDVFFLPKPFDPEQLATTVRAALDCRATT